MLQCQATLMNAWMEAVQKVQDPDNYINSIPGHLWMPTMLRTGLRPCACLFDLHTSRRNLKSIPPGLSMQITGENGEDLDSGTGLATKFLVDVQRFLACQKVLQNQHLVDAELAAAFKITVGNATKFSTRSSLLFRTNARLRTCLSGQKRGLTVIPRVSTHDSCWF